MNSMSDYFIHRNWQDVLDYLTKTCKTEKFKNVLKQHDCSKIVKYCLEDVSVRSYLMLWMKQFLDEGTAVKSVTKARCFRTEGNDKFKAGNDVESLYLYTKSVCHAPNNDEEFSLAHANRSAALFRLQHYQECLQDIDIALQSGYPEHLKYKLLLRKGKIYLIKKQCQQAIQVLRDAEVCMPTGVQSSVRNDLQKVLSVAITNCNLNSSDDYSNNDVLPPKLKNGESKELMYASSALSLKENSKKGRHIVANVDIKKGDVLFFEKPFAFVVLPGPSETVCHHCCTPVHAPIPCDACVSAVYCSQTCCNDARKKYHQWECGGLELFYSLGIAHLGLRLTLINSTAVHDVRYDQVMSLMSHIEDMQLEDAYQYSLTATLLSLYLENKTSFFVNNETKGSAFKIGGQIMYHICQLICNGHAITKIVPSSGAGSATAVGGIIESCQEEWAATAIFPSASMMNHSCDPNIINSFSKEFLIVQAVRDIPRNDEVFNCYGPFYRRMNTKERKEVLKKQYFFDCLCPPCQKEGNDDFLAKFSGFLCSKCSGPLLPSDINQGTCLDCGNFQPVVKLMEQVSSANKFYDEGFSKMENDQVDEAIKIFKKMLENISKCLYRYNIQIRECRDNIAKCYATLKKFDSSAAYLIDNFPSIEEQFGTNSVELANELQKLTDLQIAELRLSKLDEQTYRKKFTTTEYYVNKALEIYGIYYGSWNDSYKQMLIKYRFLKELSKN
ncbi:protein-lysine N-methyltransferase SMYD4-like [Lycorma delicatula]|uniref:protein-lysine N-methyltransferase SMYD4-like n=1 Tax=Lycorma delicatula TaxID=130591 RepID=UPI003F51155F